VLSQSSEERHFPTLSERVLWVSTSGTSGKPKWVALPKSGVETSAHQVQSFLREHLNLTVEDYRKLRWGLGILPSKIGGFSLALRAHLWKQAFEVWGKAWSPRAFSNWCAREEINLVSLVPTQIFDLVNLGLQPPKSLKVVLIGGDRLSSVIHARALELGWPIICTYAMTELASTIALQKTPGEDLKILPHIWISRSPDGFLKFKSESLFLGYAIQEDHSKLSFSPIKKDAEGFWTSEDRGDVVEGGHIRVFGRCQEWVKILGMGVDVAQVRAAWELWLKRQHFGEQDLGLNSLRAFHLTYRTCPRKGHQLILWVERDWLEDRKSQRKNMLERVIQDWNSTCEKWLSIELECIEKIPRGPLGKVLQPGLKGME
jgi:acyl-CoA synthetase (AMP-forming)/AMP-acid ligase II